jgi:hypothetical protein
VTRHQRARLDQRIHRRGRCRSRAGSQYLDRRAIYGTGAWIPTPETEPARPISAYGLSKRTAEEYGHWFRADHGLDVVTLRYGNVYGPRQHPAGDAGVIARLCSRALAAERPVVFGDGTHTRGYVYVGGIVSANITTAWAPLLHHGMYNIGTGTEVSVLELIAAMAQAAGIAQATFEPQFRPARADEVTRSCLDVSGHAAISGFRRDTNRCWTWHRRATGCEAGYRPAESGGPVVCGPRPASSSVLLTRSACSAMIVVTISSSRRRPGQRAQPLNHPPPQRGIHRHQRPRHQYTSAGTEGQCHRRTFKSAASAANYSTAP